MIDPLPPIAADHGFKAGSVDCNSALMRARRRDHVIVVRVTGEIDAANLDRFHDYTSRFIGKAPGLILDLRKVDFLCARGISVLLALDQECRAAGTHWAIVGGLFVIRLLRLGDPTDTLFTATSQRQALNAVAEPRQACQAAL
jgi:anti-anti-sigma factor